MSNDKNKRPKKRYKKPIKFQTIAIWTGCICAIIICMINAYNTTAPASGDLSYLQFKDKLENSQVIEAEFIKSQETFKVTLADGTTYNVIDPDHDEFRKELLEEGVMIQVRQQTADEALRSVLATVPYMILIFVFMWYILKSVGGQTTTLFKILKPEDIVTFDDVAGMSETKKEVEFAVSQLKNRNKLKEIGARPCKGIILEGPPGTGKTLLAKAIAGEAGVPFISTSGADFVEMFVGLGAARVRNLWELALTNAPCVIFIDEIDAVGKRRSSASDAASTEGNQTLNALLQRMDGLGVGIGIFVVAATNRIQDLDPALLRPGRFDKHLYVGPPRSKKDRDEVINVHMKGKKFDEKFDFDSASKLMFGLSGAEIEYVMNESALVSLQRGGEGIITVDDIDKAVMKLRASGVATTHTSESDREITAIHEAGHAIMSLALGRKVSKVSIMPYSSGIGGMTVEDTDDKEDKRMKTKTELQNDIKVLLAGREAEKILLGDTSIGCSNDIERASVIAFNIVNSFAMTDDKLVNVMALAEVGINLFDTKGIISDMNDILKVCNDDVNKVLTEHKDKLKKLSDILLRDETIIDVDFAILEENN